MHKIVRSRHSWLIQNAHVLKTVHESGFKVTCKVGRGDRIRDGDTYAEREHGAAHSQAPNQHELVLGTRYSKQPVGSDGQAGYGGRVTVHGGMKLVVVQLIDVFQALHVQMPNVHQTVQTTCVCAYVKTECERN